MFGYTVEDDYFSKKHPKTGARVLDCPQNAFELRKLMNTLESLEKAKQKVVTRISAEQRQIKYNFKKVLQRDLSPTVQYEVVPGKSSSIPTHKSVAESRRYISQQNEETNIEEGKNTHRPISKEKQPLPRKADTSVLRYKTRSQSSSVPFSAALLSPRRDDVLSRPYSSRKSDKHKSKTGNNEKTSEHVDKQLADYKRTVRDTESALRGLESSNKELKEISKRIESKHKNKIFLRSHSRDESCQPVLSSGRYQRPNQKSSHNNSFHRFRYNHESRDKVKRKHSCRLSCVACEVKLRHKKEDRFNENKVLNKSTKKWKSAPRGFYVAAKQNDRHLEKSSSLFSTKQYSKYSLHRPGEYPKTSREKGTQSSIELAWEGGNKNPYGKINSSVSPGIGGTYASCPDVLTKGFDNNSLVRKKSRNSRNGYDTKCSREKLSKGSDNHPTNVKCQSNPEQYKRSAFNPDTTSRTKKISNVTKTNNNHGNLRKLSQERRDLKKNPNTTEDIYRRLLTKATISNDEVLNRLNEIEPDMCKTSRIQSVERCKTCGEMPNHSPCSDPHEESAGRCRSLSSTKLRKVLTLEQLKQQVVNHYSLSSSFRCGVKGEVHPISSHSKMKDVMVGLVRSLKPSHKEALKMPFCLRITVTSKAQLATIY